MTKIIFVINLYQLKESSTSKTICKIEEYFDNKVKRILPLIYDKTDLLRFKTQGILSNIEPRIKDYYINIRLRLVGYSQLYEENSNLNEADTNMSDRLDCYEKYYQYKIKEDDIDLKFITNIIYDYLDKSKLDDLCYILNTVELKTKELMKEHNDSVDYLTVVYLFDR